MSTPKPTAAAMRAAEKSHPTAASICRQGHDPASMRILTDTAADIDAEFAPLVEALERIAAFSDQDEYDSWHGTDTGNADDAYDQGSENAYGACARIARDALVRITGE